MSRSWFSLFSRPSRTLLLLTLALITTSCAPRSSCDFSDQSRTAKRYFGKGIRCLFGSDRPSRGVCSRDEFYSQQSQNGYEDESYCEFIPMEGQAPVRRDTRSARPPRQLPGDPGSRLPKLEEFRDPATHEELSQIFPHILFDFDNSTIRGEGNMRHIREISNFMQTHPGVYLFVEGHTDERGPEAYNLALGSRRANSVRNALIAHGVDPDVVFTISYGKERPIVLEHHEEAWRANRRAEFKIFIPQER